MEALFETKPVYKKLPHLFRSTAEGAREHLRNLRLNITNFIRQRLYQDAGMKELIERFYHSIRLGEPLPIL